MDKIDLLVNRDVKSGRWDNVKIYTLKDKTRTNEFKVDLAPQLSKAEFKFKNKQDDKINVSFD